MTSYTTHRVTHSALNWSRTAFYSFLIFSATDAFGQRVDDQIRTEVARYVEAVNGNVPEALAALYIRDDAVASIGDGRVYSGWSTVAELIASVYEAVGSIRMTIDSVTVMPLGDDAALAYFRDAWLLGTDTGERSRGAMTLVYVCTNDGWRVAHDHTSSLPPGSVHVPDRSGLSQGPAAPVRETLSCVITRIVDGDTIECRGMGRVRLIGMDTPERSQAPYGCICATTIR